MGSTAELAAGVIRSYKRMASNLRDLLEGRPDGLALGLKVHYSQGEALQSSFSAGPEVDRLAALLRPFMAPGSPLELSSLWKTLLETGEIDDTTRTRVEQAFVAADRLPIGIALNDRPLTGRDVYFAYGEGRYFGDNEDAKQLLDELSIAPMPDLMRMAFHDVCANYAGLVFVLLDAVLTFERAHPRPGLAAAMERQCIYCLTRDGVFDSEEHVIPESLAGDELVLRDSVCRRCNNDLARLDEALVSFEPVAFLRTIYGPLTKAGKFPRARFRDVDIEKVAPRHLKIRAKTGRQPFPPVTELPDGTVRFTTNMTARRPFDPVPIARALFKIGLGLVAHDAGPNAALASRYDGTRAFVRGDNVMPNYLYVRTNNVPGPSISTTWIPAASGTIFLIDLFGLVFVFNLEPTPFRLPPEAPRELFAEFWLGRAGEEPSAEPSSSG